MIGDHKEEWPKEVAECLSLHVPFQIVASLHILLSFLALGTRHYNDRSQQASSQAKHEATEEGKGHEVGVVLDARIEPECEAGSDHKEEAKLDGPLSAHLADGWLREARCNQATSPCCCDQDANLVASHRFVVLVANERYQNYHGEVLHSGACKGQEKHGVSERRTWGNFLP